ncbi:MAG TPA: NAD(P)-dependent oxidoreductase [Acidimicrobiales bacterium]|nr:NAD(P)-dependent oxidoreductase [Acidimicrobiales bacterium]
MPTPTTTTPAVAVEPTPWEPAAAAVAAGGGRVVPLDEADAVVWVDWHDPGRLAAALAERPRVRWVHLPGAGIESFLAIGPGTDGRVWTCSKGAHSVLIAEHAMALALAGLHGLPEAARRTAWGPAAVGALVGRPVTVVGGGGIATALVRMLAPFEAPVTVVRRRPDPVPGAVRTLPATALHEALPEARLVVLALALTPATTGIIGAAELARMHRRAWLVNVSRGRHVDTDALVAALGAGTIGGAALDVTDPEPLPEGHPLWGLPNCIVTPHSAGASAPVMGLLARRVEDNVRRFAAGLPLVGVIDPEAGY